MSGAGPSSTALQAQAALDQHLNRAPRLENTRVSTPEAARDAATEFEGVFLSTMIGQMFEGLPTEGRFHGGFAEKIWRQHMVTEWGQLLAKGGGVGLAEQVYEQVLRQSGIDPADAPAYQPTAPDRAPPPSGDQVRAPRSPHLTAAADSRVALAEQEAAAARRAEDAPAADLALINAYAEAGRLRQPE